MNEIREFFAWCIGISKIDEDMLWRTFETRVLAHSQDEEHAQLISERIIRGLAAHACMLNLYLDDYEFLVHAAYRTLKMVRESQLERHKHSSIVMHVLLAFQRCLEMAHLTKQIQEMTRKQV